jgi:hypothetical protein
MGMAAAGVAADVAGLRNIPSMTHPTASNPAQVPSPAAARPTVMINVRPVFPEAGSGPMPCGVVASARWSNAAEKAAMFG